MSLDTELKAFWEWADSSPEIYAKYNKLKDKNETDYCLTKLYYEVDLLLHKPYISDDEYDDLLTAMALDNEVEDILELCSETATDQQITKIVQIGIHHIQSNARWQVAELLSRRYIENANKYLSILLKDNSTYVRKRAQNSINNLND